MTDRRGPKWLACGCLGLIGLGLLVVGGVVATGWLAVRSEELVEPVITRDATLAPPAGSGGSAMHAAAGRVVVVMSTGEAYVEPAEPGEPLTVDASYDPAYYELTEGLEPGEPWTYRVKLRHTRAALITAVKEMIGGSQPRVRVRLPLDVPLALDVDIKNGTSNLDLGHLWVTTADLKLEGALLDLRITEPLRFPMERVSIRGSKGAVLVQSLDKAAPAEVEVDFRMGNAQLDLRGAWPRDARFTIDTSMADFVVRLPRRATIEGLATTRTPPPPDLETAPPTLSFSVSSGVRGRIKVFE